MPSNMFIVGLVKFLEMHFLVLFQMCFEQFLSNFVIYLFCL